MNLFNQARDHCLMQFICAVACINLASAQQEEAATPPAAPAANIATVAPATPWSFNLTLVSRYVSRGFDNNMEKPALQVGGDYVAQNGNIAGFWMSNVSDKFVQGSKAEMDFYAGHNWNIGDVTAGVRLYYYYYPNGKFVYDGSVPAQNLSFGEFVPFFSYKWFSARYCYTYTQDFFGVNDATMFTSGRGHSRGSGYLDLNGNFDLGAGYSLQIHYGHQNVKNFERVNWSDGRVGITKSFGNGFTAGVAATKVWAQTTENIYGAGYTYDWTKYTVSPNIQTVDPIKSVFIFSLGKAF